MPRTGFADPAHHLDNAPRSARDAYALIVAGTVLVGQRLRQIRARLGLIVVDGDIEPL